jgi:hypothetical protein
LANPEYDEFRRANRRNADETDKPPIVEVILGHGGPVAADEVGLFRFVAEECAVLPLVQQKIR